MWTLRWDRLGPWRAWPASVCLRRSLVPAAGKATLPPSWDPLPAAQSLVPGLAMRLSPSSSDLVAGLPEGRLVSLESPYRVGDPHQAHDLAFLGST